MSSWRDAAVGQQLVRWREARNMQAQDLAEKLGINRQRLWDWETRGVPIGVVKLVTLAMRALQAETTS